MNDAIGAELMQGIGWTDETLARLVSGTLINGATQKEWWARQERGFTQRFCDEMRMGMAKGETLAELRDRIIHPAFKADLRTIAPQGRCPYKTARRNAEALVRTSTLTVMREAHLDVYQANADVIGGVQWVSTLDGRTTPMCRELDLLEWTLPDYEPKGHGIKFPGATPHWNCRSVVIPVTKSWEELAKEAGGDVDAAKRMDELYKIKPSERASMGGPVDAGMTYKEWLETQDEKRREEIKSQLSLDDFGRKTFVSRFAEWFNNPEGILVAGKVPLHIQELLETDAEALLLGFNPKIKQKKHPEVTIDAYVDSIRKVHSCTEIYEAGERRIALIIPIGDDYFRLALKTNENRTEIFMLSLHKMGEKSLSKYRRTHKRLL